MNVNRSNPIPTARSRLLLPLLSCAFSFALSAAAATEAQPMKVAFVLTEGANVIDMTGPWEVFQDTMVGDRMGFELFTVGESSNPVTMTGGLRVVPEYTFANAPPRGHCCDWCAAWRVGFAGMAAGASNGQPRGDVRLHGCVQTRRRWIVGG